MSLGATTGVRRTFAESVSGIVLPVTIIGAILVFVIPLPTLLLDLLLAANLTLAVVILLTVLAIRTPQEFSSFPTVLVTTTLTRLVLNVATTRLILVRGGQERLDAAGGVIRAFGEFVAQEQVVVGGILFAILVVIQFVVITKGATRISEVAARFTLDGLPGRQMAIDADLHAGLIDQAEAARRRDAVYRQADFFGAMDGASKFVRGDAIAGVIITVVNILGGLFIGVIQHGMGLEESVSVFTKLTIGDGLVSQVPAFLISLAAGLIVTRSSSASDLGRDVTGQLFARPAVLGSSAAFLVILSFTGLPQVPLLSLAGALGVGAWVLKGQGAARLEDAEEAVERGMRGSEARPTVARVVRDAAVDTEGSDAATAAAVEPERMEDLLQVDPLELGIGYRLIGLADPARGGDLLERIRTIRQRVARELGIIVPQIRIRDELGLGAHEYRLKIRGTMVGHGTAYLGRLLAVPPAGLVERPDGRDGVDPVTGEPAIWIHGDGREVAELAGCRVLEAPVVIASHLGELIRDHADTLLTHEQVRQLLDRVRASAPGLVEEVVPALLRVGEVRRLLQNLVRERVSIRDLEAILEALAEHAGRERDLGVLTERVRMVLGRQIAASYLGPDGRLRVVDLSDAVEHRLGNAARASELRPDAVLGPDTAREMVRAVAQALGTLQQDGHPPVIVCASEIRTLLKDLTRVDLPRLAVLSRREIPRDLPVEVVGSVVEQELPVVTRVTTERVSLQGIR